MADKVAARCVRCRAEYTATELLGAKSCPTCGTQGLPMDPAHDVAPTINWHELRILAMWAERWALACDERFTEQEPMLPVVFAIVRPLQEQFPSYPALTLSAELDQLRDAGYEIETSVKADVAPKPPKLH